MDALPVIPLPLYISKLFRLVPLAMVAPVATLVFSSVEMIDPFTLYRSTFIESINYACQSFQGVVVMRE